MQILQWLAKGAEESPNVANSVPINREKVDEDQRRYKLIEIVSLNNCGNRRRNHKAVDDSKVYCESLSLLYFIRRRDISKAAFYNTLNLKTMKTKREDVSRVLDCTPHVGNKVLPITETPHSSDQSVETKEKPTRDKMRTLSRIKELIKWAAAAKADKGGKHLTRKVFHFRSKVALKSIPDNDESPKISFGLDMESCPSTSSIHTAVSAVGSLKNGHLVTVDSVNSTPLKSIPDNECVGRKGNWITTDTEFVVLEL